MGALAYLTDDGRMIRLGDEDIRRLRIELKSVGSILLNHEKDIRRAEELESRSIYFYLSKAINNSKWSEEKIRAFCNGRGKYSLYESIGVVIESINNIENPRLADKIRQAAPILCSPMYPEINPVYRYIVTEFDENLENQISFDQQYKGNYFIFRRTNDEMLTSSMMSIGYSYVSDIPKFRTSRVIDKNPDKRRIISGVIYRSRGIIYSIGRNRGCSDLRMAVLRRHVRNNLTGVRLGINEDGNRPYVSPIYVVKISNEQNLESRIIVEKYTGRFSEGSFKALVKSMSNSFIIDDEDNYWSLTKMLDNVDCRDFGIFDSVNNR